MEQSPLFHILKYLPPSAERAVRAFAEHPEVREEAISEIRLRAGAPLSVTYEGRSVWRFSGEAVILSERDTATCLGRLCEDSVHTYGDTVREGFVALAGGYRIGVVGRAGVEGDGVRSVLGISSLSIRIPHSVTGVASGILPTLCEGGHIHSTLFYAPPNVGKTTLLRDIALALSTGEGARRVAIIDTRGEIGIRPLFSRSLADILAFYPRGKGIEIATRTLSPDVILCDEIGTAEEAAAILSAENSGVPLIATAHGDSFSRLLLRPNIRLLYDSHVFRYYIGLFRPPAERKFRFAVTDTEKETKEASLWVG